MQYLSQLHLPQLHLSQLHLPQLQLSQAHFQILETCPRKFQYFFLDSLAMPQTSTVLEKQELGSQFHQLMQQRALGLEIQPLLDHHPKLQEWLLRFQDAPPPFISGLHHNEYPCTLTLENFTLIAVFDLLIQGDNQAQVVDWKTYRRPHREQLLKQHWQTRLYLYLVVEVLGFTPDQVSMLYWFAESNPERSSRGKTDNWLSIPYSASMHQETQQTLAQMLSALGGWMQDFVAAHPNVSPNVLPNVSQNFPQVPLSAQKCWSSQHSCPFLNRCYPPQDSSPTALDNLMDLAAIAELPLD
jgi:PD-(D/E)XK nuclease superfamily